MTLVIPEGFSQVVYRWTLAGDPEEMLSTIGIDHDGVTNLAAIASDMALRFESAVGAGGMSAGWTFRGVKMYSGVAGGGPPIVTESNSTIAGTGAWNGLPSNCALLVKKQTARGGRQGRGRMYLPAYALNEIAVDQTGTCHAVSLPAWQADIDQWFDGQPCVLLHDSASPAPTAPDPITSFVVDGRIATQRRRMRG